MSPIVRALRLFSQERGLWKYTLRPLLWGLLAYALVVALIAGLGAEATNALGASPLIGALAGFVITIFLGGTIYLALVGLIAGFGFDRLSIEVEERVKGVAKGQPLSFAAGLGDGLVRAILAGILGLVALCGAGTFVIPWLVASFLSLMDFTASPLTRRGASVMNQFGAARRLPGAIPFALLSGAILLIPVVNVLSIPILVTAGTLLVLDHETVN